MIGALDSILITACIVLAMMTIERFKPLHYYQRDTWWIIRLGVLGLFGISLTSITGAYLLPVFGQATLFPTLTRYFAKLPYWLNGFIGYFCISFFIYWWHRLRHHSDLMWKIFHQIHHSTYRLEALTALYAHPSDFVANTVMINIVCYCLLGFDVYSATWAALWVGAFEFWEHTNVKTPHWLGYIIVRPEMHRIHHERNRHLNNYGLPIWDLIFGTYENSSRTVECGFPIESEKKLVEMLGGKAVE